MHHFNSRIHYGNPVQAASRKLVKKEPMLFSCSFKAAMSQGVKATGSGWRFFIRSSINTHRKPVNEVRRQVQVYLENPMEGW